MKNIESDIIKQYKILMLALPGHPALLTLSRIVQEKDVTNFTII